MKILFTADIHANKKRIPMVISFLEKIQSEIRERKIDLFIIGGDLWDSTVTNTKASGFVDVVRKLNDICRTTKLLVISGTPKHEPFGSIDFIESIGGTAVTHPELIETLGVRILALPELRRSDFIEESAQKTAESMRQKLSDVCRSKCDIIVYHGEVAGASYDNGETASGDVQLTRAMIDSSCARIVLAGHIHKPQSVMGICHYVGSPIPVTFGETHSGSVIYMDYSDGAVRELKRLDTGFPVNRTVDADLPLFKKMSGLKYKNTNLKIRLSLTAEERKLFHIKEAAEQFKRTTEASSVSIAIISQKEVSVRTKEIRNKKSITEKLKVYADVNGISLPPSVIQKSMELEDSLLIKYQFPSHSMELLSLSLRGAIGLSGREQIDIDFSKFDDGLLCILGENGKGKSTVLENCQPYPQMLTRSGALKNHFYLKDSHRILVYQDENGKLYKFLIFITAHIQSGSAKYLAETSDDGGATWTPVKDCDGNLDAYQTYVESVFGSLSLFLRTSFFAKEQTKGMPDIASATKGQRIELVSHLIGTDDLSAMHEMTKERLKAIEAQTETFDNVEEQKETAEEEIQKKSLVKKDLKAQLKKTAADLEKNESEIKELRKKQADYNQNVGKYGSMLKLKGEYTERLTETEDLIKRLKEHRERNEYAKTNTKYIELYRERKAEAEKRLKDIAVISERKDRLADEYHDISDEYHDAAEELSDEEAKFERAADKIKRLELAVGNALTDKCPVCGAKLSEKKRRELMAEQIKANNELTELKEFSSKQKSVISALKKEYTSLKNRQTAAKDKYDKIQKELSDLREQSRLDTLFIDANRKRYEDYLDYVIVDNIDDDIEKYTKERSSVKEKLNALEGIEEIDYETEIEKKETLVESLRNENLSLSMSLAAVSTELEALEARKKELDGQCDTLAALAKEFDDYSILEAAFCNGGIQALELEAAAPDIAVITNSILSDCYGDKFVVNFSTLHQGKTKMINDFSIDVTNTEKGLTAPIEYLSSGEKIWIMQALYYAFSIIRMERTGFSFRVRFCDECDGSLDSEMKLKYVDMISSAHKAGNARLTVLVTHSQEVKDIMTQVINL